MTFSAPEGKPKITKVMNYSDAIYIEFSPPHESKLNGELAGYVVAINEVDCHDKIGSPCEKDQVLGANVTVSSHITVSAAVPLFYHSYIYVD